MAGKNVFVTVGTTEFDQLIQSATSASICEVLRQLGYTSLVLQIGKGRFEPKEREVSEESPAVKFYRLKDSIAADIASADLVISHAGAGSVLETLAAGKSSIVVINDQLMGNHQEELARQLQDLDHLFYCTCGSLDSTLRRADFTTLRPFPTGDPKLIDSHLKDLCHHHGHGSSKLSVRDCRTFLTHLVWLSAVTVLFCCWPQGSVFGSAVIVAVGLFLLLVCL